MAVLVSILVQALMFLGIFSIIRLIRGKRDQGRNAIISDIGQHFGMKKMDFGAESILTQLRPFKLFERENRIFKNGRITDVYHKMVGDTNVYIFEYAFTKKKGKSSKTYRHLAFFADDKNWFLPNFKLEPETWWHKVMAKFGKTDINFPNNENFSDSYWLTSEFEAQTRKLFRPELKAFLNAKPPIKMEGSNYYLLAHVQESLNSKEGAGFVEDCLELVKLLKNGDNAEIFELAELQPTKEMVKELIKQDASN